MSLLQTRRGVFQYFQHSYRLMRGICLTISHLCCFLAPQSIPKNQHWGQWHINASVNWAIIAFNNVACPAPSHYLNQCWPVVYWTIIIKLKGNLCENLTIFIQKYYFNMPSEKWQPFCLVAVCLECYTRSCVCYTKRPLPTSAIRNISLLRLYRQIYAYFTASRTRDPSISDYQCIHIYLWSICY